MGCPSAGGTGGKGGDVLVECVDGGSLAHYAMRGNRRHIAEHGTNCKRGKSEGKPGKNKLLTVPPGTILYKEDNTVWKNMDQIGEKVFVARGGMGGSHRTSNFNGKKGESKIVLFELKLIGDIGLVGFPNAGKSTLLRSISNATPKVADYAFTTLRPTVGIVKYPDHSTISYTDLPGLIEDAHLNRGMGHKFLRHVERTKAILMVIDINGFELKEGYPPRSALETIALLLRELYLYQKELLSRRMVLALNKVDTDVTGSTADDIRNQIIRADEEANALPFLNDEEKEFVLTRIKDFSRNDFENVVDISAMNGDGLLTLTDKLREVIVSLEEDNQDDNDQEISMQQ